MVIAEQAKSLYEQTLEAWASNNPIISEEEKSNLDKMAAFLSMEASAVEDIHSRVSVPAFVSVVLCPLLFGILSRRPSAGFTEAA